ncbi:MFS transporter, partial [Chloroflexota bacterium]
MKKIFYGWWVVGGAFIIMFWAAGGQFYAFPVFFDAIVRDMGWSRAQVALALSLGMLVSGIIAPLIGVLINKIGVRPIMIVGSVVAAIGFLLLSTVSQLWQLYLFYIILAIGMSGIILVPNFTLIKSWFTKNLSTAIGIAATGIGVGGAVIAPVTALIISTYEWRNAFLILAAMVILFTTTISATIMRSPADMKITLPEEQPPTGGPEVTATGGTTFGQAMKGKAFWLISLSVFFWGWAYTSGIVHQVAFAVDMGIDRIVAAGAVGLVPALSIAGRLGGGRLGDLMDKRYVFMMGTFLQIVAFTVLLNASNLTMLYVYSALLGLNIGGLTPILPGLVSDYFG